MYTKLMLQGANRIVGAIRSIAFYFNTMDERQLYNFVSTYFVFGFILAVLLVLAFKLKTSNNK